MDTSRGSFAISGKVVPLYDPSVLIVGYHPGVIDPLAHRLRRAMPDVVFDVSLSQADGLSRLRGGNYHAVISDTCITEADNYALLHGAQALSYPLPLLLFGTAGEGEAAARLLTHGAFDVVRDSARDPEASKAVGRALWLYQVRRTIAERRQRLNEDRSRLEHCRETMSEQRRHILTQAIQDLEQSNRLSERTVRQIESSLLVLEDISRQFESEIRNCALRLLRLE